MENLYITIVPMQDVSVVVEELFKNAYQLSVPAYRQEAMFRLQQFLLQSKLGIYCCIEYPYVDKLYRNEYYHFFSSKLYDYKRDCIRLSFFSKEIVMDDFRNAERVKDLQEHYLGFLVLRPTFPAIIGRNVLSPLFFTNPSVAITCSPHESSINGIKLIVRGFPHASQDTEMMVCAETTIWSLMEHFSHRYAEYKPVLPNEIHNVLSKYSPQRQVPSAGLNVLEICFALKQFGFGVRIYSRRSYSNDFDNIIKTYVESGIPVVAAIENTTGIGHVVNIIGRKANADMPFKSLKEEIIDHGASVSNLLDTYNEYVMIDDNHPAYRLAPLSNPALNYAAYPQWNGCTITNFIVPLYTKVYLEADAATALSKNFFTKINQQTGIAANNHYSLRTFLASSRSLKQAIAISSMMVDVVRDKLLNTSMPKFVWVTELITAADNALGKASGMILLDATEKRENEFLVFYLQALYLTTENGQVKQIKGLLLRPFNSFYNLKTY